REGYRIHCGVGVYRFDCMRTESRLAATRELVLGAKSDVRLYSISTRPPAHWKQCRDTNVHGQQRYEHIEGVRVIVRKVVVKNVVGAVAFTVLLAMAYPT